MAWIHTVPPDDAEGLLARLYREALRRAGKVFGILRIQSLRPEVLQASTRLYSEVMLTARPGGLGRAQKEMLATVVSRVNGCHY